MYLHLGQDIVVKMDQVIGIFDLENSTVSQITRNFLAKAEKQGQVVNVSMEMPKTFVVCSDRQKNTTVYISQISAATLRKRTNFFSEIAL